MMHVDGKGSKAGVVALKLDHQAPEAVEVNQLRGFLEEYSELGWQLSSAAHHQTINAQGWLPYANRHALPIFTAYAHAFI